MFIQVINSKRNNKIYTSTFLMESYRENGTVKHRTLANLSKLDKSIINQLNALLKGTEVLKVSDLQQGQGKSCGGLVVAMEIAKRLGITQALGNSNHAKIALLQIFARLFVQGSQRNILNVWIKDQAIEEVLQINDTNLDELYTNLDWLSEHQAEIQKKIFKHRTGKSTISQIYLYDVTSSYLEGTHNELASYGYNRDKKKGKMQIVIGLLCDDKGYPISVEAFTGNTSDTNTVSNQLLKLKDVFDIKEVIFVGDKGMIKSTQIEELNKAPFKWHYITSITKAQINTLINQNIIQLSLFDDKIIEIQNEEIRYILRRNPVRATEIHNNRMQRIECIKTKVNLKNTYLTLHPKAKLECALRQIEQLIKRHKFSGEFISLKVVERSIQLEIREDQMPDIEELDGCYVIKTDVNTDIADSKTIHDRYKDLSKVEFAFRTIKTGLEEIRPIFVRTEKHTRGHLFICMLSYMIAKYLQDTFSETDYTIKGILSTLDKIQYSVRKFPYKDIKLLPTELLTHQHEILNTLNIKLPAFL